MSRQNLNWIIMVTALNLTVLAAIISSGLMSVEGQMIPISEVMTHDPKEKSRTPPSKAKIHAKIAEKHFEGKQHEDSVGTDHGIHSTAGQGHGTDEKVTRKDKPIQFQDPTRHASETGLLNFLLEQYKLFGQKDTDEKLEILQNLEHFAHKFENGRDLFVGTDALKAILLPALNSTSADIRKASASIFAIAAQNNPVVQSKSVEAGAVRHLLHLVTFDKEVRVKALFAISTILRNYPNAQKEFIKIGGVSEIVKVAFLPETRRRSLTFLMDLLNERKFCHVKADAQDKDDIEGSDNIKLASDDPCDELRLLDSSLKSCGWCELLVESIKTLQDSSAIDDQILVIEAIESSLDLCSTSVSHLEPFFVKILHQLEIQGDPDFEGTKTHVQNILAAISAPTVSYPKVEL